MTFFGIGLVALLVFAGGFSLDLWRVYSQRRALAETADAAAAAGANGLDLGRYRAGEGIWLDPPTAEALAWQNLAEQIDVEALVGMPVVTSSDIRVDVELVGSVELTWLGAFTDDGAVEFVVRAESGPLAG
ncbi:MAG: pilus assembly protein TadG-related protein [Acidimicrobiales bacterium]